MLDTAELDRIIDTSGFADAAIERMAGLSFGYLRSIRAARRPLTRVVFNRVQLAVARIRRGEASATEANSAGSYRLAVAFVAMHLKMSPEAVISADPARRATADKAWLQASRARRWAIYIANQYLNMRQAELARAAKMSKAAVSIAMNDVEDERGDPHLEQLLAVVEGAFSS